MSTVRAAPCCVVVLTVLQNFDMASRRGATRTRSFRIDPKLVTAARRATGASDDTEAVRIALAEVVERARFRSWVRKVAGKGQFRGVDK